MRGRPQKSEITIAWSKGRERWLVNVPPSITGQRMQRAFLDREQAEIWRAEQQINVCSGREISTVSTSPKNVRPLIAKYERDRAGEVVPEQLKLIKNHLAKFAAKFGGLNINEVDPLECRMWLKSLPLAQRTRWGVFSTCRTFYRWLMRYDLATTSPFDRMEPLSKGDAPKEILSVAQMRRALVFAHAKLPPYVFHALIFGGFCGMRPSEVRRSIWSQVDFEDAEIYIPPHVIKRDAGRQRGMRDRTIAMPDAAIRLLPRGLTGRIIPVSETTFQTHIARLAAHLGLEEWPHDCLRHSAATYKLACEKDAGAVATWLGHTAAKTTLENYARGDVKKRAADEWWALWKSVLSEIALKPVEEAA